MSYRGRGRAAQALTPGADVLATKGLATSRDPRLATSNFAIDALHAVVGDEGHRVEGSPGRQAELAVWFSAGTTFRVLGAGVVDDTTVTVLHQLDTVTGRPWRPLADVEQVLATYARDVAAVRGAGVARVGSPGKFVGEVQ